METVHVINLPERIDRRVHIQREAAEQGFNITFWQGIHHHQIPQLGVCLAHKQVVHYAKVMNWPEVIIAEDDCKFFAPGAFQYFIEHKPKEFDLYLGGVFHGAIAEDHSIKDWCGMTLYMVSSRFYDTFFRLMTVAEHLDRALGSVGGKYYVCDPFVCTQIAGWSDNKSVYRPGYDDLLQGRRLYGIKVHD